MKKLLLASALLTAGTAAQAQVAEMPTPTNGSSLGREIPMLGANGTPARPVRPVYKSTATASRWYNMVDHIAIDKPDMGDDIDLPYMWATRDMKAIYGDGNGGIVADTIDLNSYGMVLHPFWSGFNDRSNYPTDSFIYATDQYTLDSVKITGVYGRNSTRPNVVDTMILSAVYGGFDTVSNITTNYRYISSTSGQGFPYVPYGVDTLRFASPFYNATTMTAGRRNMAAPVVKTYKLPMANSILNDTVNGFLTLNWAPNLAVPAGKLVAVTATFKSGDTYVPYDTAFRSASVNPTEPFKYGMWRALFFNEVTTDPITQATTTRIEYRPGSWNNGLVNFLPPISAGIYLPTYAFWSSSAQSAGNQWPDISFKLTKDINRGVKNVSNGISVNAYPNPVSDLFTVPVSVLAGGDITVKLTNAVGQTLATQNFRKVAAGQKVEAKFNLSSFANGLYFYTVEAAGERVTNRVVVAH